MSVRTRPLGRNDGAAHQAAPEKGPDPNLRMESCRQVSPSRVRDACGPHDSNERTRKAIASDGVQRNNVVQQVSSAASHRSAMPFFHGLRNDVGLGMILVAFTAAITSNPNFASRSKIRKRGADSKGKASRSCWTTHPLLECLVTLTSGFASDHVG
jgi:hypothetical protein